MNIKQIAAREGLIIAGIALVGFLFMLLTRAEAFGSKAEGSAVSVSLMIWLAIYPLSVLIRIIIWAVKTVRAK